MPDYDINEYRKFRGTKPKVEEPSLLQQGIDTFKRIDKEITEPVQQKFEQAIGQLGDNPLAGGLNLLNALGGAMAVPFMALDKIARLNSVTEKIADVVAYPFEKAGQLGTALMPNKQQLDQMLLANRIVLTNEALQETSEALDEFGGMAGMFALGGGIHKGVKTVKGKVFPKEIKVDTKVEKPKQLTEPKRQFQSSEVGSTYENIPQNVKIERGKLKLDREELINERAVLKDKFDSLKGKKDKESKAKRTELFKQMAENDKMLKLVDTELLKVGEGEVKQMAGLLPERGTSTKGEISGENRASNINFAVATEPGAKTTTKMGTEKVLGVKRSVHDFMKDRNLNIFELVPPDKPIDPMSIKKTLDLAKEQGIEGDILTELRKEAFRRGKTKEFEEAYKKSKELGIEDVTYTEVPKDQELLNQPKKELQDAVQEPSPKVEEKVTKAGEEVKPSQVPKEEIKSIIEQGGGKFDGIQKIKGEDKFALVTDPETRSTYYVPIEGLTPEVVKTKIETQRKNFKPKEEPTKVETPTIKETTTVEKPKISGKKKYKEPQTLEEAVLDYVNQFGTTIKPTKDLPKSSLEALGIPKNKISENGMNPEYIFETVAPKLWDIKYGKEGEAPSQSAMFEELLHKYSSHEARAEQLKKYRGEFELTPPETTTKKTKSQQMEMEGLGAPKMKGSEDYLKMKGRDESTTPLFREGGNFKPQPDLFNAKRKAQIAKEWDDMLNSLGSNQIFNPKNYVETIKWGADLVKSGLKSFTEWSKQMITDLGEKIKPHLLRIWDGVKKELAKGVLKLADNPFVSKSTMGLESNLLKSIKSETALKETPIRSFAEQNAKKLTEKEYNDYAKLEADKKTIKGRFKLFASDGRNYLRSLSNIYDKFLKSTDRQVESVSQKYFRKLTQHDFDTLKLIRQRENTFKDFVNEIAGKFDDADLAKLKLAMLNGDGVKLNELFSKYRINEKSIREVLNEVGKEAGFETTDSYFPRGVKDYASFIKKFEGMEAYNIFERLINEKQSKFKEDLTDVQKFAVIDNALRGYNSGITLAKLGNEKNRVLKMIDASLAQDYYDPIAYLGRYLADMTEMLEARKFFGKNKSGDTKSIGEVIFETIQNEKLDWEKANKLRWALYDRFQSKRTPRSVATIKKAFYIEKLSQFRASLTQLKDLSMALYRTGAYETTKAIHEVLTGKKNVKLEDLSLLERDIAREISDISRLTKVLDESMKWAGFSKFDKFGKETFINSYLNHFSKQAKKNTAKFNERIDRLFEGAEKEKVRQDLINKTKSDEVKLLLFSELTRTQPVSKSSLPSGYHQSSYGRLLYTARTFAVRRLNFIIDEIKSAPTLPKKMKVATRLAVYMGLLGASVDVVENILTGNKLKPEDLDDTVIYNLMDNIGLNRYFTQKFGRDQFTEAISSVLSKLPIPYVDNIYADIKSVVKGQKYKANIVKSVPVAGRAIHDLLIKEKLKEKPKRRTY